MLPRFLLVFTTILLAVSSNELPADSAKTLPPDLVVRIVLEKDSLRVGEPLVGKIVFTNNSPIEMKLFYPGFKNKNSISSFGARVEGVLPNGKPRIVCQTLTDEAETKCEVAEVKLGPAIGAKLDTGALLEYLEILELDDEMVAIKEIPAGKEVSFDFRYDDCREAIPNYIEVDKNGRTINDDEEAAPIVFGLS